MLNNVTNFFNLIKNGKVKKTLEGSDLIPTGTLDPRSIGGYQPTAIQYEDLLKQISADILAKAKTVTLETGLVIKFDSEKIYNTHVVPGSGNITNDLTGALYGITQKIYHNSLIAPSMPSGWVLVGGGIYVPGVLNIINAEWFGGTRVEYWVTQ